MSSDTAIDETVEVATEAPKSKSKAGRKPKAEAVAVEPPKEAKEPKRPKKEKPAPVNVIKEGIVTKVAARRPNGEFIEGIANDDLEHATFLMGNGSDFTRVRLLALMDGTVSVQFLADTIGMTQPAVSHHLALLRHGQLVKATRNGKQNFYQRSPKGELVYQAVVSIANGLSG